MKNIKIFDAHLIGSELNDDVGSLLIEINDGPSAYGSVGYVETPEDELYEVLTREEDGTIGTLEIVDPKEFLESPTSDNLTIYGENMKELVKRAIDEFNIDLDEVEDE